MIKALLSNPTRVLQAASILIAAGLLTEAATLNFIHPFAFMGFIFISGTLIGIGVLLYLWTLFRTPARPIETD